MRAGHHEVGGAITTAVVIVLAALVGLGGVIRLAQNAAELGPNVGAILTFDPGHRMPYDHPPQVSADLDRQTHCILDTGVMHQLGGSLIIESRSPQPNRVYQVHWAGRHTSEGPFDCGRSTELRLTQDGLDTLALAAGGYGVSHHQLQPARPWQAGGSAH